MKQLHDILTELRAYLDKNEQSNIEMRDQVQKAI